MNYTVEGNVKSYTEEELKREYREIIDSKLMGLKYCTGVVVVSEEENKRRVIRIDKEKV